MATDRYHHGSLATALLDEAAKVSRKGGPDAIVLRTLAANIGVTPASAYRHFADRESLILALSQSLSVDMTKFIQISVDGVAPSDDTSQFALDRFSALVHAYIEFAETNPGWYRVIFQGGARQAPALDPSTPTTDGLLAQAFDELAGTGVIAKRRRQHAELWAWACVHGLVSLRLDGPLARLGRAEMDASEQLIIANLLRSLAS